jgi:lipoprotein-anchoring transpeptidase ErfK/SrfK
MSERLAPLVVAVVGILIVASKAEAVGIGAGILDQTDPQAIQYRIEGGPLKDLAARFKPHELGVLEKLNRADVKHLSRLETIVIPSEWRDETAYSPFPRQYVAAAPLPKLLIVDQPSQAFAAYEFGQLVHWGPTSTGRQARPTPTGLYHLNWRARTRTSTLSGEWRLNWYYNFHNTRGLAFHEFDLPGVPASHACVRLLTRDAMWIYNWGDSWTLDAKGQLASPGTPVVILGSYNFSAPPPFRSVDYLARGVALPAVLPGQP